MQDEKEKYRYVLPLYAFIAIHWFPANKKANIIYWFDLMLKEIAHATHRMKSNWKNKKKNKAK